MADIELEVDIDSSLNNVFEKSASAPSSPSDGGPSILRDIGTMMNHGKGRRVTFPDDDTLVTGYFDAPDPWSEDCKVTTDNIVAAYRAACWKQGVKPLLRVLQQLQINHEYCTDQVQLGTNCLKELGSIVSELDANVHHRRQTVQANENCEIELDLKGENLDYSHCEALEEIFKRLQFKTLELEGCNLDDEGAAAIFDMIEYYDSTSHLNISCNKSIGNQGWQACSKMLKKTPCLQFLDARGTSQNEQSLLILGRAFRTGSNLAVLHLENCGLFGRPLVILVAAVKLNTTLLELYLGENRISSADGLQLGNLLRSNSTLELLDLRTNNLQDLGLCHLIDGLCQQTTSFGDGLKTLILTNNHVTYNGMAHVNRALLVSTSMNVLDIGQNAICSEGIHQLKQGLLNNQTLRQLGLQNTKVTCEGAVALAECIADNQYINYLDLRDNDIKVAGLMALALSMNHNHSMIGLELDQIVRNDLYAPDGLHDYQKLLDEIQEYCNRNKNENAEMDEIDSFIQGFSTINLHHEAELSSVYREKSQIGRAHPITNIHPPSAGMVCSASFPTGSRSSPFSSSSLPRNRFQVCRVFLDGDKKSSTVTNKYSSGISIPASSEQKLDINNESCMENAHSSLNTKNLSSHTIPEKNADTTISILHLKDGNANVNDSIKEGHDSRLCDAYDESMSALNMPSSGNKENNSVLFKEITRESFESNKNVVKDVREVMQVVSFSENYCDSQPMSKVPCSALKEGNDRTLVTKSHSPTNKTSCGKGTKKITFLLPECEENDAQKMQQNRRMSSPAITSSKLIGHHPKSLTLKLGRQLESLDLRSSVPLSPTRLQEGLIFPDPFDLKFPLHDLANSPPAK